MKFKVLFAASMILLAVLAADAQTTKLEQQFTRLQRAQDDAEEKKDIAALERIFSDDFIFIAANGRLYDKKKLLDEIKADTEPAPPQTLDYEDFKVRSYGKTAVVNYVVVVRGKDKEGKETVSRFRMSAVWIRQKGNWRMANIHATRVR